jgi:2,3-diaminopropionate biosynthesis protein SbnB
MRNDNDIHLLRGEEIATVLAGRELEVIDTVRAAYELDAQGGCVSPSSVFVRFHGDAQSRIIAKAASLTAPFDLAGLKWVSSFPTNCSIGLARASAILILNSIGTGRPFAILEGSIINSVRTAASAALAAKYLHPDKNPDQAGFVGCGPINFEIVRYLRAVFRSLEAVWVYDTYSKREDQFEETCSSKFGLEVFRPGSLSRVLTECRLVSFATNAVEPHVRNLEDCRLGSTVLHISLRDFSAEAIAEADNIVDNADHACTANTSLHLAERQFGNRKFIRCCLGEILRGTHLARPNPHRLTIFSPFGMAFLDIAVGRMVLEEAVQRGFGLLVDSFMPGPFLHSTASLDPSPGITAEPHL